MAYRALRRQHYLRRLVTGEASCLAGNLKRANKRKIGATPELASVETSIRYPVLSYMPAQPKIWLGLPHIDLAASS
jgi:hypothetical protein